MLYTVLGATVAGSTIQRAGGASVQKRNRRTVAELHEGESVYLPSKTTIVGMVLFIALVALLPPDAEAHHNYRICRAKPVIPNVELCRSIRVATHRQGLPASWAHSPAMRELLWRESRWYQYAVNRSSGACGWFQLLPCRCFPASIPQGACGVRYIKARYGTPTAALAHHDRYGWY